MPSLLAIAAGAGLWFEDDNRKVRLGRYSGEEAEERALVRSSWRLRMPGMHSVFGPSLSQWLGVPVIRSSRPKNKQNRMPFTCPGVTVSPGFWRSIKSGNRRKRAAGTPGSVPERAGLYVGLLGAEGFLVANKAGGPGDQAIHLGIIKGRGHDNIFRQGPSGRKTVNP